MEKGSNVTEPLQERERKKKKKTQFLVWFTIDHLIFNVSG